MDISNAKPAEILSDVGLEEYEKGMDFFYFELVELNAILYIAEQIIKFPFDLFTVPDQTIFFGVVMRSLYDSAILIITRLVTDQSGDLYTLIRFKNRVRDLVKPEYRDLFALRLKAVRFDKQSKDLFERARQLRLNRIAHTTHALISGSLNIYRLNLSELQSLRDVLNSLLQTLSFSDERLMLPVAYSEDASLTPRDVQKTDVEELLDCLAKKSNLLNLPERNSTRWFHRRDRFDENQLNQLNHYRRKFGLPEV